MNTAKPGDRKPADAAFGGSSSEHPIAQSGTPSTKSDDAPPSDAGEALTPAEKIALDAELEKQVQIIQFESESWRTAAAALLEIRDRRLYRAAKYSDFGRFCKERLKLGRSTVNRRIAVAQVYKELASAGVNVLPTSERQLRPLLGLKKRPQDPPTKPTAAVEIWNKAVEGAQVAQRRLTENDVALARQQLGHAPEITVKQPELNLQKRWVRLKAALERENELWPIADRIQLAERIITLVHGWQPTMPAAFAVASGSPATGGPKESDKLEAQVAHPEPSSKGSNSSNGRFDFWPHVNWHLRNCDLAVIWGVKEETIKQRRWRKRHGPALETDPCLYRQEMEAERAKAAALKKT